MKDDLALTTTGAIAVRLGEARYPLVFSIAGIKEWAEYRGQSFQEVLTGGWRGVELSLEDAAFLLKIALKGGEARRRLFEDGEPREITDQLAEEIMGLCHPTELFTVLVKVWDEPPVREPDPRNLESPQPGA